MARSNRYQTFVIRDFAGLNEDENPDAVEQNELSSCINVWKHGRSLGTRPGVERDSVDYDGQIASAKCVHGLHEMRWAFDANRKMVAVCGGAVHYDDTNTLTLGAGVTITDPGAGTANAGKNLWTFAVHKNVLYMAGGADGDTVNSWDGNVGNSVTKVTFQNSSAADIDAKYIFEKYNYLFLNGMNGTTVDDNPMVGRFSAINDGSTWPVGNTFGGTSAVGGFNSYGDEFATGWGEYTDNRGDYLLFLTNKHIYPVIFTGSGVIPFATPEEMAVANGCVNQRAFVNLGIDAGDCIYLSDRGVHSLRQSQQYGSMARSFLSWKIRPTIARLNQSRLKQSVSAYWPEEGIVLFAVPTGSNTHNDTILCLDLKGSPEINADNARWYVWQLAGGYNANYMTVARDASDGKRYLYIGDTAGNVLRFSKNVFSDLGTAYTAKFVTKHNDYDVPGTTKGIGDVWIGMQPGGDYTPSMRFIFDYGRGNSGVRPLDMGDANPHWDAVRWNEASWGNDTVTSRAKVFGTGRGDTIAFEFSHAVASEPYRVTMLAAQIRGAGETQGTSEAA